jgi:leukotriene-A4 hydrolase
MIDDPTTQSNFLQIRSTHVEFCWDIDWESQTISGSATHTLLALQDNVQKVVFDTNGLDICRVSLDGRDIDADIGPLHAVMGSSLTVPIPPLSSGAVLVLTIHYRTTNQSVALQWLDKEYIR